MVLNLTKIYYFFVTFLLILPVSLEMQHKLQQPVLQFNPIGHSFTIRAVQPASELEL
jgi:hypothetical protein